jgi:predicted AlkP superfamily phosphohydrolase/phosphomutase
MRSKKWAICSGVLSVAVLASLVSLYGCGGDSSDPAQEQAAGNDVAQSASGASKGRVVILGFDGVEPTIVEEMMDAGELPNLAKLRDSGSYSALETSIPPQSPTAWSSFITSKYPGSHGIYDFLRRTPSMNIGGKMRTVPGVGYTRRSHARLSPSGSVVKEPSMTNLRAGEPFWMPLDRAGKRTKILHVPFAFPADPLQNGYMLCGLGVPDLRNTDSTFYSFSESYSEEKSVSGGVQFPLDLSSGSATVSFPGARDGRKSSRDPNAYTQTELTFKVDRSAGNVTIESPGGSIELSEGEWSEWAEWSFEVTDSFTVRAISRFLVVSVAEPAKIYMSCLQFHPDAPYIPISNPESYATELKDRYGFFKTVGWIYDTHALRQDALPEDAFLQDVRDTMAWREELVLDELDRGEFDLLVGAWTGPDRVSHLFWRFRDPGHPMYTEEGAEKYGDAVEETYRRMDETVGKVVERLQEDDLLMVLSDHGFHSFRKGFNVNTWLIRNGYQGAEGHSDPATAFNNGAFLDGIDWAKTKAYSLGLGSVFINVKGREAGGIVAEEDVAGVIAEISAKLAEVVDPDTGDKIFSKIYTVDDFTGIEKDNAPDIQLGYAELYQSAKASVKGSAPKEMFEVTNDKWSGEHAASDFAETPGIFYSNQTIDSESPRIIDLGATALHYLNVGAPRDFEGESLLN